MDRNVYARQPVQSPEIADAAATPAPAPSMAPSMAPPQPGGPFSPAQPYAPSASPPVVLPQAVGAPEQPSPAEKLVKYFPAEAFALYASLEPLVFTTLDGDALRWSLWGTLFLAVVFCVLYLRQTWKVRRVNQLAISCVTLVVYVAALGGPFETIDMWDPAFALAAAVIMTAFIIFVPAPVRPEEA